MQYKTFQYNFRKKFVVESFMEVIRCARRNQHPVKKVVHLLGMNIWCLTSQSQISQEWQDYVFVSLAFNKTKQKRFV